MRVGGCHKHHAVTGGQTLFIVHSYFCASPRRSAATLSPETLINSRAERVMKPSQAYKSPLHNTQSVCPWRGVSRAPARDGVRHSQQKIHCSSLFLRLTPPLRGDPLPGNAHKLACGEGYEAVQGMKAPPHSTQQKIYRS